MPVKAEARSSKKARNSAARLAAVQALYQMDRNSQSAASAVREYIDFRLGQALDGEAMVAADPQLFSRIVSGASERRSDLDHMIAASLGRERPAEPLLNCILLCGAYELLANLETDAPVIISDYLHVTDAFFGQGEKKLINAVLDKIAINLRGERT